MICAHKDQLLLVWKEWYQVMLNTTQRRQWSPVRIHYLLLFVQLAINMLQTGSGFCLRRVLQGVAEVSPNYRHFPYGRFIGYSSSTQNFPSQTRLGTLIGKLFLSAESSQCSSNSKVHCFYGWHVLISALLLSTESYQVLTHPAMLEQLLNHSLQSQSRWWSCATSHKFVVEEAIVVGWIHPTGQTACWDRRQTVSLFFTHFLK